MNFFSSIHCWHIDTKGMVKKRDFQMVDFTLYTYKKKKKKKKKRRVCVC